MKIPIILIHSGSQSYINYAIKQAAKFDNKVILLSDRVLDICESHIISNYEGLAKEFDRVYIHMSSNTYEFENKAWRRWFVLAEFMSKHHIKKAFSCDTDVLLYCNISDIDKKIEDHKSAFSILLDQEEFTQSASLHSSLWTIESLHEYCKYSLSLYSENLAKITNKWEYHQKNNIQGGICDMTAAYFFYLNNKDSIVNLSEIHNNSTFDESITYAGNLYKNEYPLEHGIKKIQWRNGVPYSYNYFVKKEVKFNSLHFQGNAKPLMEYFFYKDNIFFQIKKHLLNILKK
jgi:hypothetical protein